MDYQKPTVETYGAVEHLTQDRYEGSPAPKMVN
jgi:hypothetical protein